MAGIISYGVYVPDFRIKADEIARQWGENAEAIKSSLLIEEKSVPDLDEDAATIAVEASRAAIRRAEIDAREIGAIYVGSESHPYAVKPTATIVAAAIGASPSLTAADWEFACKAATASFQAGISLVESGRAKYVLCVGADVSQSAPRDPLEFTAAAGAAAFLIGSSEVIAEIEDFTSFTTDTPDFWRRDLQRFPSHGGRFTGEPAYFRHTKSAAEMLMHKTGLRASDFDFAVFHQPNGKFPLRIAQSLGFRKEQVMPSLIVTRLGNTYSASSLIGFAAVLDIASPGDRILLCSFGSGAGSDAFSIRVTSHIEKMDRTPKVKDLLNSSKYLNYAEYAKHTRKIVALPE